MDITLKNLNFKRKRQRQGEAIVRKCVVKDRNLFQAEGWTCLHILTHIHTKDVATQERNVQLVCDTIPTH